MDVNLFWREVCPERRKKQPFSVMQDFKINDRVEYLPSKHEAMCSNLSTIKKKSYKI
jgi:hypothetical protein